MKNIEQILSCLENTPRILSELLSHIPAENLKIRRNRRSWSIHEHACHIASGDKMGFLDRLRQFVEDERPVFTPLSGESFPADYLAKMDLTKALKQFFTERNELVRQVKLLDDSIWEKRGNHPEYIIFTPSIMLRHRLLHAYYPMYRIEELWLTKDLS